MSGSSDRVVLVVNGRVHELSGHRSVDDVRFGATAAWWGALALLGAALLVLGGFVTGALGTAAAIGGVVLFLGTAVVAGAEQYEFATALGTSAVVWTATGISLDLGADPSLSASAVGFALVGFSILIAGAIGTWRNRARPARNSPTRA
jgi:hypothetical protein